MPRPIFSLDLTKRLLSMKAKDCLSQQGKAVLAKKDEASLVPTIKNLPL